MGRTSASAVSAAPGRFDRCHSVHEHQFEIAARVEGQQARLAGPEVAWPELNLRAPSPAVERRHAGMRLELIRSRQVQESDEEGRPPRCLSACAANGETNSGIEASPSQRSLSGGPVPKEVNGSELEVLETRREAAPKSGWIRGGSLRLGNTGINRWRSSSLNMGEESQAYRKKVLGVIKKKNKDNQEHALPPFRAASHSPPLAAAGRRADRASSEAAPLLVYNRCLADCALPAAMMPMIGRETRANSSPLIVSLSRRRSESCETSVSGGSDGSLPSVASSEQERQQRG
ncbi:uncharacterized protein LOC119091634 [Pollicipes pollicipes]|uniref:uncharacterized protein LOC119091634 n=1 Tax=Pollicipes pollicipes TaxID=41117 RepID=UPI0018852053|nr:uncharacterized protein LOC119091634 [Pollicipes pollicipes]